MRAPLRIVTSLQRQVAFGYGLGVLGVVLVTALIGLTQARLHLGNVSMLYLAVILAVAGTAGSGPAIVASLLAVLAFNWFFIEPVHTLVIADPDEWVALLLFLLTAVVTGQLAGALRRRADEATRREREAVALYEVGQVLMGERDLLRALRITGARLRTQLGLASCAILLANEQGQIEPVAVDGEPTALAAEQATAAWVLAHGHPASQLKDGLPARWVRIHRPATPLSHIQRAAQTFFVPLKVGERTAGVLRLKRADQSGRFSREEERLITAAAGQLGLAIERARLQEEATAAEVLRRTADVKTALLNSVSHNLRTPLASIKASVGSLLQEEIAWDPATRREFAVAIDRETDRLNRLVGNLLDMSRLEAGVLVPAKELYLMGDLIADVRGRLRPFATRHRVAVDVPDDLPPVPLDYVQIDQVLTNLLENAFKYTSAGSEVRIVARQEDDAVRVSVADTGPGIPPSDLERVFEPFYRAGSRPGGPKGTGLGLAVARGLIEAHGGRIWASATPGGGATVSFTLPLAGTAEQLNALTRAEQR